MIQNSIFFWCFASKSFANNGKVNNHFPVYREEIVYFFKNSCFTGIALRLFPLNGKSQTPQGRRRKNGEERMNVKILHCPIGIRCE